MTAVSFVRTRLDYELGRGQPGAWLKWGDGFGTFKEAMDAGYRLLKDQFARRIEIQQVNLQGKWVSMGIFDLKRVEKWYRELEEAKEREKWR